MSRPWLGSKGSWERKPQVSKEEHADNFNTIFSFNFSWLEYKKIQEAWINAVT